MVEVGDLFAWTEWVPLRGASRHPEIPRAPGLYRVRRVGRTDLDYVGQTGMRLGDRLQMLSGIWAEEMPYRDPHTAAPALWALRHSTGCEFEVSVTPVEGSTAWRKGLEALAIGLYRQQVGRSPIVEFGRMPPGYRASSGNNARLVRLGKRFRGGLATEMDASHGPGLPPAGPLSGDPQETRWGGHDWSAWMSIVEIASRLIRGGTGLYRIRGTNPGRLVYIGQGLIPARPIAHLAKTRDASHAQGQILARETQLEVSWVLNDTWLPHQRLELENDLIAAHILVTGEVPAAQFLG